MPESPLLFSCGVPACGSCLQVQSRSRGVKESRSGEANRRPRLSARSLGRRWAIPGVPDSSISRPASLASEPGSTAPKKHKNNTIEASMLLKTNGAFSKQTQNEPINEANFEPQTRESSRNSKVARSDGKKPLTWLATLATLSDFCGPMVRSESDRISDSPGKRAADEVWSGTRSNAREYKNSGNEAKSC